MAIDPARRAHLFDAIYDAPFAADPWSTMTEALEPVLRGRVAVFRRSGDAVATLSPWSQAEIELTTAYEQSFWQQDRAMQLLFSSPREEIVRDTRLIDDSERPKLGFYHDFLARVGAHRGLYATITRTGQDLVVISAQRPRVVGDYDSAELQMVQELLPHIRRSMDIRRKLAASHIHSNAFIQALDHARIGIILVDAGGRMQFANICAERQLNAGAIRVTGQKVGGLTEWHSNMLHRAIARATVSSGAAAERLMLPYYSMGQSDPMPMQVLVSPVRSSQACGAHGGPLAMLILGGGELKPICEGQLRKTYGLTPAEARLLEALVKGERLGSYAERSGVALSTVKTHLSSLFSKTGEQRQADLIRRAVADSALTMEIDFPN